MARARGRAGSGSRDLSGDSDRFDRMLEELDWRVAALGKFDREVEDRKLGRKTQDKVFDRIALQNIYKLFTQGWLESVDFPIAPGKEAVVYCGTGGEKVAGRDVAVKIYNTSNAVFRNLINYIEGDPRFRHFRRGHRNTVNIWVAKEFKNLNRIEDAGIRIAHPWGYRGNVLVMEFLGSEFAPALQLRQMGSALDWESTGEHLVELMVQLVRKARLVHADFSAYNLMVQQVPEGEPHLGPKVLGHNGEDLGEMVLIDVGQAVPLEHPGAPEFLERDIRNLVHLLATHGVDIDIEDVKDRVGPIR